MNKLVIKYNKKLEKINTPVNIRTPLLLVILKIKLDPYLSFFCWCLWTFSPHFCFSQNSDFPVSKFFLQFSLRFLLFSVGSFSKGRVKQSPCTLCLVSMYEILFFRDPIRNTSFISVFCVGRCGQTSIEGFVRRIFTWIRSWAVRNLKRLRITQFMQILCHLCNG